MTKGQRLSINTVITAAIALVVLVVLIGIFTGRIGPFDTPCLLGWSNETHFCNEFHNYENRMVVSEVKDLRWDCGDNRLVYTDNRDPNIVHPYTLPKGTVQGIIFNRPQYIVSEELINEIRDDNNPIVCDVQRESRLSQFSWQFTCDVENETLTPDTWAEYPYKVEQVLCCWGDYCYKANESLRLKYVWTGDCRCINRY